MKSKNPGIYNGSIVATAIDQYKRMHIFKLYYAALFFYTLPFVLLFLFIADQLTIRTTDMVLWVMFLVALGPCGLIGIVLSVWGIIKASQRKSRVNKVIGLVGLCMGVGGIIAGILGVLLIYIVVS
jgi:hypothetical protein